MLMITIPSGAGASLPAVARDLARGVVRASIEARTVMLGHYVPAPDLGAPDEALELIAQP